jgi:hypothetical protein
MKIALMIVGIIAAVFIVFQIYTTMSTSKSETQAYKVIQIEKEFEIRHYPSATMALVTSSLKSYRELGNTGFRKLAGYIFGGNKENKRITMTSPVHMEISDTVSSMSFVMPTSYNKDNLPQPNNSEIKIKVSEPEYVAALQFGGFATTSRIEKHKAQLKKLLEDKGISYYGNFRYLGYNPPFQLFGRRNEVIVAIHYVN